MSLLSRVNVFKSLLLLAVVAGNSLTFASPAQADSIDFSRYAAVAFSESTGEYGYAWDQPSYGAAAQVALSYCKAKDAKIVGWVRGGWLALAIGADDSTYGYGFEHGDGAANTDAINTAVREVKARGQRVKTLVVLCSGDIDPKIYHY